MYSVFCFQIIVLMHFLPSYTLLYDGGKNFLFVLSHTIHFVSNFRFLNAEPKPLIPLFLK